MKTLRAMIGKFASLLDKYRTIRLVGDVVMAFALLMSFDPVDNAGYIRHAFVAVMFLLLPRALLIIGIEPNGEMAASAPVHIFRGVTGLSAAVVLLAVVVPFAVSHGAGWTALLSVFGGYLLLCGAGSCFPVVSQTINRRRDSRTAKKEELLAELRAVLSGE